jgi:iron(III) transport system substrate-binding protein
VVVLPQEDGVIRFLSLLTVFFWLGCSSRDDIVVYTSQDQFYAEPIFASFTKKTGVKIRAVFDSESAKTAGLANRLRAEQTNPQCDLFWNNEEMHTRFLEKEGVLAESRPIGYRTRRLVVNTTRVALSEAPKSLLELTNAYWKGKIAFAYPLFGTTCYHFLALRQHWGIDLWQRWCAGLVANQAKVVDGNSMVVKLVGLGEAWIGLTDSDDIAAGKRQGWPILELSLGSDSVAIPNTIAQSTKGRRHPMNWALVEHLCAAETIQRLVEMGALEGADSKSIAEKTLTVDWSRAHTDWPEFSTYLTRTFVRL